MAEDNLQALQAEWEQAFTALREAAVLHTADHPIAERYRRASDALNHANRRSESQRFATVSKVTILITSDENTPLGATLHRTEYEAYEALAEYLRANPVSYQDPLSDEATQWDIRAAADDRSQFMWEIQQADVPLYRPAPATPHAAKEATQ
jgi:hypothetical protein